MRTTDSQAYDFSLTAPDLSKGTSAVLPALVLLSTPAGVVVALASWANGYLARALFFGMMSLAVTVYLVAYLVTIRGGRRGHLRFSLNGDALTLTASKALRVSEICSAAIISLTVLLLGWRLTSDQVAGTDVRYFMFSLAMMLAGWAPVVRGGKRILDRKQIRLSPARISLLGVGQRHLDWDDFATIEFSRKAKGMVFSADSGRVRFNPTDLRSDPALVADLVQYYKDHPEARPELTDHRVIQRIRFHQFNRRETGQ
jgi:hypothetical protein